VGGSNTIPFPTVIYAVLEAVIIGSGIFLLKCIRPLTKIDLRLNGDDDS